MNRRVHLFFLVLLLFFPLTEATTVGKISVRCGGKDVVDSYLIYEAEFLGRKIVGIVGSIENTKIEDALIPHEDIKEKHLLKVKRYMSKGELNRPVMVGAQVDLSFVKKDKVLVEEKEKGLLDVTHRVYKVANSKEVEKLFGKERRFIIIDGHHRVEVLKRWAQSGVETRFPVLVLPLKDLFFVNFAKVVKGNKRALNEKVKRWMEEGKGDVRLYSNGNVTKLKPKKGKCSEFGACYVAEMLREGEEEWSIEEEVDLEGEEYWVDLSKKKEVAGVFRFKKFEIENLVRKVESGKTLPPKTTCFLPKVKEHLITYRF